MTDAALTTPWSGRSIPQVFEQVALAHHDRIAIEDENGPVGYAQLLARARHVAAVLRRRYSAPGQHVAVLAAPSADAVTALLGILLAGHVYVPIDPDDPAERVRFVLADADVRALLAAPAHLERLGALSDVPFDLLPLGDWVPDGEAPPAPDVAVPDDALAFVLYTSGSTGHPKGVLQTHRNLLHYAWHYSAFHAIVPSDRVSLLFSPGFAASSLDIYGALLRGATLCILNLRTHGAATLGPWLESQRITIAHTVPTVWRVLLTRVDHTSMPLLRALDLGGEAIFPSEVEAWRSRVGPRIRLTNRLAATEVSLIAHNEVADVRGVPGPIPVGAAQAGVRIRVVTGDGRDARPNEPGAILIESPFLSPGYWRQPEMTAARFPDGPSRPGWRVYRSGDTGMLDERGQLTMLGRHDAVVKVRGFSVHLAEVEAALRRVDGVESGAVAAVPDTTGPAPATRIVAFVVGTSVDPVQVRRRLLELLPRYACPAEVHRVQALPLTSSGKVDHGALAQLPRVPFAAVESEPPRDALEHEVASLFASTLGVPPPSRDDDFFDLGGDSMRLTMLQLEVEQRTGLLLTPQALLEAPTVARLAALIRTRQASGVRESSLLMPVRTGGTRPPLFMVHGGTGELPGRGFLDAVGADQPVLGFRAQGMDGRSRPLRSVPAMADAYVREMRRVRPEGPYFIGGSCAGCAIAAEMACQLRDAGQQVAPLLLLDPPKLPRHQRPLAYGAKLLLLWGSALLASTAPTRRVLRTAQRLRGIGRPDVRSGDQTPVWVAFRLAAYHHRPRPYAGDAFIIASRHRIETAQRSWRRYLTGDVRLFEVSRLHHDVFDPTNADMALRLREVLEAVAAWFGQHAGPPAALPRDEAAS